MHRLLGDPRIAAWFRPNDEVQPFSLRECEEILERWLGHWGRGIATRLGSHALDRAAAVGLEGAIAYARVENVASRRVMEKLGLAYEREFEHVGRPHVIYRKRTAG